MFLRLFGVCGWSRGQQVGNGAAVVDAAYGMGEEGAEPVGEGVIFFHVSENCAADDDLAAGVSACGFLSWIWIRACRVAR